MKKEFIQKVLREGAVDTRDYRYVSGVVQDAGKQYRAIKRISRDALGTTSALNDKSDHNPFGWETVAKNV